MQKFSEIRKQITKESFLTWDLLDTVENLDIQVKEWQQLVQDFPDQPSPTRLWWHFRVLLDTFSGQTKQLLDYLPNPQLQNYLQQDSVLRLYIAQAYLGLWQIDSAHRWLETLEPPTKPRHAFWYWSTKALVAVYLEQPFDDAFDKASRLCQGHELGTIYLNWAFGFERIGQLQKAIFYWREALNNLRLPSYALALTHYSVAQALVAQFDPEATEHFARALDQARYKVASRIKSTVLCGLGDWKRLQNQLEEAKNSYTRALKVAEKNEDIKDQINANAKLGYVVLLQNQQSKALEYIQNAKQLIPDSHSDTWVYTIEALLFLQQKNTQAATAALARAISLGNIATERKKVLCAELERQQGNLQAAREYLSELDISNVGARELVLVFPEVFRLMAGLPTPQPIILERKIQVKTLGVAEVYCNGKKIRLSRRCLELLIYLLYYQQRTVEEAVKTLSFEELAKGKSFADERVNFHKSIEQIRAALLWDGVLKIHHGICTVGTEAVWQLDWLGVSVATLKQQFLKLQVSKKGVPYREREWVKDILDFN